MAKSRDILDCCYPKESILVSPSIPSPRHSLYLSNLDDHKFLRYSIKYLFLNTKKNSVSVGTLKASLSEVFIHYYPLAGRLRNSEEDPEKLEMSCNGEGAVIAKGYLDLTVGNSWRGLEGKDQYVIEEALIQMGSSQLSRCSSTSHPSDTSYLWWSESLRRRH